MTQHELAKILVICHPNAIEPLGQRQYIIVSDAWEQISDRRNVASKSAQLIQQTAPTSFVNR